MILLRSLLFNVLFYVAMTLVCLAALPTLLMPRIAIIRVAQWWALFNLRLLRWTVGLGTDVRGRERIPPGGLLVAAKHQSVWETFALMTLFDRPMFILKRELIWIPVFGWLLWKAGNIAVDRSGGAKGFDDMNAKAAAAIAAGRQLIIFPEGTRRPPGAEPAYKSGVALLYRRLGAPCLPVALNSGVFWPRRSFLRRPGTVVVDIGEPIPPGMQRAPFGRLVEARIEYASARLLAEAGGYTGPEGI